MCCHASFWFTVAGMIVLIVVFINNKNKKYKEETLGFELFCTKTFWHFLGFLWLYLFVFLYFFR